ncbi:MAG: hypothetical protein CMG57_05325 [Candidatus Marinimicrobia bacterium]|nr:hypothetical protein [Candidatus Neomarinimicrobiota bacterium]
MNKILISLLFLLNIIFGINPPKNGKFPDGFWEKMEQQNIGKEYGDPGWVKKISNYINNSNRDTQLEFLVPVLLGKYADVSATYFNASDYDQLLFGENPTGSMKDYYLEISYGNFLVDGTSGGWYQSTLTMSQAVENTKQYVAEIAALADPDFDYAQYDNDGPDNIPNSGDDDGYVDGILIVYSGCGAEWGPGNNNLWPHMSSLGAYEYQTNDIGANGSNIIVSSYAVNPELAGGGDCYTDIIRPMGVYAHEFGHILGLPDLYDRDSNNGNSEGVGEWCLMASGGWMGWAGDRPAHMSAWCKIQLGWINPTVVTSHESNMEIPQVETSPFTLKIWEDDYHFSRYFLLENRQSVGFDDNLHGPGIIMYHVNENRRYGPDYFSGGSCNDDETDKLVDIEEADGNDDLDQDINRGDDGDPFPGSSANATFDNSSYPSSLRNDGSVTGISVTNISEPDSVMTADIIMRPQYGYGIAYDELGVSSFGFGNSQMSDKWGGVLFTAEEGGFLTEVDFGVRYTDSYWTVSVYESFDGTSPDVLIDSITGYSGIDDWVTVLFDSIPIAQGEDFFVAVKYHNKLYPVCFDRAGIRSNRSYYSTDGVSYSDYISDYGDVNIRAKISTNAFVQIDPVASIPERIGLFPNYPNPFNSQTTLSFTISKESHVKLEVYGVNGNYINTLINKKISSGRHEYLWNGFDYSSGIYFVKFANETFIETQKIMLLK